MALKEFPSAIDVVLGSNWDGTNGLDPTDAIRLHWASIAGDERIYTEDGTLTPNTSTNRIYLTLTSTAPHPFGAAVGGAWDYGTTGSPDVRWAAGVSFSQYTYTGDYTFGELWAATVTSAGSVGYFITGTPDYNPGIFASFNGVGQLRWIGRDDPDEIPSLTFTVPTPLIPIKTTPDPIVLTLAVPAATAAKSTAPAAVAITFAVPAVSTAKVFAPTPDPVAITFTIPDPILGIDTVPDPVAITFTLPDVTLGKSRVVDALALALTLPPLTPTFVPSDNIPVILRGRPTPRPRKRLRSVILNPAAYRGKHYHEARGLYRVFNAAAYRFYRNKDRPPKPADTPWATSASLPDTPADTFSDGRWKISVSFFDGCLDSGFLPIGPAGETYLLLEIDGGAEVENPPAGPLHWQLEQRAAGVIRINAIYLQDPTSTLRADDWAIAYTTDGSIPGPDAPDLTSAIADDWLSILAYDLPGQANGTTVTVRLQTRRGSSPFSFSTDSITRSATADAAGPSAPLALAPWRGLLPARH